MSLADLQKLRSTMIVSNNDLQRGILDEEIITMHPAEFNTRYRTWLGQLQQRFTTAHELCEGFNGARMSEYRDFCVEFDQLFKANYHIPLHVKAHLDYWIGLQEGKLITSTEETGLLQTPSRPAATLLITAFSSKAANGNEEARQYLDDNIFLHKEATLQEICNYGGASALEEQLTAMTLKKSYFMTGKPLVRLLDDSLSLDNLEEYILWKAGNHRLPILLLYRKMEECFSSTYTKQPDKINVDKFLARMEMEVKHGISIQV